jgi:hypothetical protein
MRSKFKIITVFLFVFGMVGIAIGTHFYYAQNRYKIENLPCHEIIYIKIFDHGIAGENAITLANKDSISAFTEMLLNSKPVDKSAINFHSVKGTCDIVMHCRYDKVLLITLYHAALMNKPALGGIVSSGAYHYRNDALLGWVMKKFNVKD